MGGFRPTVFRPNSVILGIGPPWLMFVSRSREVPVDESSKLFESECFFGPFEFLEKLVPTIIFAQCQIPPDHQVIELVLPNSHLNYIRKQVQNGPEMRLVDSRFQIISRSLSGASSLLIRNEIAGKWEISDTF